MNTLDIRWLGSPQVLVNGNLIGLETRKVTALLALLSLERRPLAREYVSALLWRDFGSVRAPANLRRALASLQASLGPGWIRADRESITMERAGEISIDFDQVIAAVRDAQAHHTDGSTALCDDCSDRLEAAVRAHSGEFLQGFNLKDSPEFDEWQMDKRDEITEQTAWALDALIEHAKVHGRPRRGLEFARRRVSLDEFHEPAHRAVMLFLAEDGKRSAALRQYDTCVRLLRDEFGDEPDTETQELADRIRRRRVPAESDAGSGAANQEGPTGARVPIVMPSRLRPPAPRAALVERERLFSMLDEGARRRLTLVSAPAGFGKTTLVSEWVRRRELTVAWLSVEEADDDPAHLLAGILSAFGAGDPDVGVEALNMLQSLQAPPRQVIIRSLLEDLERDPRERLLVLDDLHFVTGKEAQDLLFELLSHLPPECRVVAATRMDPAFPLGQMRARAEITEVRAEDLRFQPPETSAFLLETMGINLKEEDVTRLNQRTEGWAAGLQMAGLSLRNRGDASAFIRSFGGSHRYIADYLMEEVFGRQPPEWQEFLLRTSILQRFCADLCNELLGRTDSQETIEAMDRVNLFVIPLDDERLWYRYHHLFSELLSHRLRKLHPPEVVAALHARSGRWLLDHQDPEQAMRHYLLGEHYDDALQLLDQWHERIMIRGGLGMLQRWSEQIPQEMIRCSPEACVSLGSVLVWAGRPADAEDCFAAAELALSTQGGNEDSERERDLHGRAATMRAFVADAGGHTARAVELAREGERLLLEGRYNLPRTLAPYILGKAYRYSGKLARSEEYTIEEIRLARQAKNAWALSATVHEMFLLCKLQGRLHEADRVLSDFEAFPREPGSAGPASKVFADRAELLREIGELESAAETVASASKDAARGGIPSDRYYCSLTACRVALSRGDYDEAHQHIRGCDDIAREALVYVSMFPLLEVERSRVMLETKTIDDALSWVERHPIPDEQDAMNREAVLIARSRVLARAGKHDEAAGILEPLRAAAETGNRYGRLLEILVLLAAAQTGEAAHRTVTRALEIAEPEGHVCVFLDEGSVVVEKLKETLHGLPELPGRLAEYAARLISIGSVRST